MIRSASLSALAAALLLSPGASRSQAEAATVIKVATMAPRTKRTVLRAKKFNKKLMEATAGRVKLRTYYGGVMGDDHTVLRKIRSGQIDASAFGVPIVANFVRQASVLSAPRTFSNYRQVDAVRRELTPGFDEEAFRNGFKVLSWWDFGKVRMFSRQPVRTIADLRTMRPWLYPHSPLLKQFYKNNGVTGVPLSIREVYGALQVGMIDTVWASAVAAMALQWNTKIKYMSEPLGIIQGAFVLSRKTWERLDDGDQKPLRQASRVARLRREAAQADDRPHLRRGVVAARRDDCSEVRRSEERRALNEGLSKPAPARRRQHKRPLQPPASVDVWDLNGISGEVRRLPPA